MNSFDVFFIKGFTVYKYIASWSNGWTELNDFLYETHGGRHRQKINCLFLNNVLIPRATPGTLASFIHQSKTYST